MGIPSTKMRGSGYKSHCLFYFESKGGTLCHKAYFVNSSSLLEQLVYFLMRILVK